MHTSGGYPLPFVCRTQKLVGIAESLGEHGHYHGNLSGGPINAELHQSLLPVGKEKRIDNLVYRLIQNAYQPENQYRERIDKHPLQQLFINPVSETAKFGNQAKELQTGCYQIGNEDIPHQIGRVIEPIDQAGKCSCNHGHSNRKNKFRTMLAMMETNLMATNLMGRFLKQQISKRNAQKSIECHHYNHHSDEIGMIAIFQKMRDRLEKRQAENGKYQ